jgi:hypothetical protein
MSSDPTVLRAVRRARPRLITAVAGGSMLALVVLIGACADKSNDGEPTAPEPAAAPSAAASAKADSATLSDVAPPSEAPSICHAYATHLKAERAALRAQPDDETHKANIETLTAVMADACQ